jgi:hypothetical protein
VPTKASLFGLDIRFRPIDQKLSEEKKARSLSKLRMTGGRGGSNNRHVLPMEHRHLTNRQSMGKVNILKSVGSIVNYTAQGFIS